MTFVNSDEFTFHMTNRGLGMQNKLSRYFLQVFKNFIGDNNVFMMTFIKLKNADCQ